MDNSKYSNVYINDIGEKWYYVKDAEKNETDKYSKKLNLWGEIGEIVYDKYNQKSKFDIGYQEVIQNFLAHEIFLFNAEKGKFSSFMQVRIENRKTDYDKKELTEEVEAVDDTAEKYTVVKKRAERISLDKNIEGLEDTYKNMIPSSKNITGDLRIDEIQELEHILIIFLSLVLNFSLRHKGRGNNSVKQNYYRMFFTDSISYAIMEEDDITIFKSHEREIFKAIKQSFLDFFTYEKCKNVDDISKSNIRKYGEMVEGKPMEVPEKRPFAFDIYRTYLEVIEEISVSIAAISIQRKEFFKFIKDNVLADSDI